MSKKMGRKIKSWMRLAKQKGYTLNGCTDSPDFNFRTCCDEHDFHYSDLDLSRLEADNGLAKCMWNSGWKGKLLAPLYWLAVRVCGGSHYERKQENAKQELIKAMPSDASTGFDSNN